MSSAAMEIETTEDVATFCNAGEKQQQNQNQATKKLVLCALPSRPSSNPSAAGFNRQKIDVKRSRLHHAEQSCGNHGRELIKILRSDSDRRQQQSNGEAAEQSCSLCKRVKKFGFCYVRQWTRGFDFHIVFASHLIFWMSVLPGIAFGSWLQIESQGGLGITEVLVSTCLCGIVFGILGTQPLTIVGVSVPSLVFIVAVSHTARRLSLDFVPWLAWIGLWCSLLLLFLAASGACKLTAHLTFFSWEVLRLFVGLSLLWIGITEIVRFFSSHSLEASLLSLWLATCTFVLAVALTGAQAWRCLNAQARELIQNYGPALTFFVFTVLPLLPKFQHIQFQRVDMPDFLYHSDKITRLGTLVNLKNVPMWAILLAFIPGALLACMIFVDHSAASVVLKHAGGIILPEKSPRSWDLFIVALLACACSLLGLPFCYGLSTQSIAHKRALIFQVNIHDEERQQKSRETIKSQRVSVIIVSLLCGVPLAPGVILLFEKIPIGVIAGMFLEMAYSCLRELKVVKRSKVFFTVSDNTNSSSISARRIYCAIQVGFALIVSITSKTPAALVFPLFILLVIWFRHYLLVGIFTMCGLASLDSSLSSSRGSTAILELDTSKYEVPLNARSTTLVRSKPAGHVEIESSSSPHSRGSPSMLIMPSTRRLKERSRRRNKRKRQASGSAARTEDDQDGAQSKQRYYSGTASNFEQEVSTRSFRNSQAEDSEYNKENSGVFGRSKRRAVNIELHSNLLYDHHHHVWSGALPHGSNVEETRDPQQSPATYESPHRPPSPASSHHVNGFQQTCMSECIAGGSNSSHSSQSMHNKRKPSSAVFSTTQNPCFVQDQAEDEQQQRQQINVPDQAAE